MTVWLPAYALTGNKIIRQRQSQLNIFYQTLPNALENKDCVKESLHIKGLFDLKVKIFTQ